MPEHGGGGFPDLKDGIVSPVLAVSETALAVLATLTFATFPHTRDRYQGSTLGTSLRVAIHYCA